MCIADHAGGAVDESTGKHAPLEGIREAKTAPGSAANDLPDPHDVYSVYFVPLPLSDVNSVNIGSMI